MKSVVTITLVVLLSACGEPAKQSQQMLSLKLECPNGSSAEIERWGGVGENGWLKACKMKHGTFTAWHGEVKTVEGEYRYGAEKGIWIFWDRTGKKIKEVTYKAGKQIDVKEF